MNFDDILNGIQKVGEDIDKQLKQIGKDIDNQKRKIFNEPIQDENIDQNSIIDETEEIINGEDKEEICEDNNSNKPNESNEFKEKEEQILENVEKSSLTKKSKWIAVSIISIVLILISIILLNNNILENSISSDKIISN